MLKEDRRKQIILRLFILLFTVSVSSMVVPGFSINSYGLLGEVKSVAVDENKVEIEERDNLSEKSIARAVIQNQAFNKWLLVLAMILFAKYIVTAAGLSERETLISMNVRMNN